MLKKVIVSVLILYINFNNGFEALKITEKSKEAKYVKINTEVIHEIAQKAKKHCEKKLDDASFYDDVKTDYARKSIYNRCFKLENDRLLRQRLHFYNVINS
ncbi:MAG: hypothetical protein P4L22_04060 [Candidatus Babeliales bacterium]|nr:hypothetical protein [Candidatus Babeliales bacterium]